MKILSVAEVRAKIAQFPPELRADGELIAFSMYDEGQTSGYANLARATNPFAPPPPKPKGKAR